MSFRAFVYYSALCGGWAAFVGWALGEVLNLRSIESGLLSSAAVGGTLGLLVAGVVEALEAIFHALQEKRWGRITVAILLGLVGGLTGGLLCQILTMIHPWFRILGWAVVGMAIGIAIGMYDLGRDFFAQKSLRWAQQKLLHGLFGGALGGLTGGLLFTTLEMMNLSNSWPRVSLALALVILGTFIGLLIGLAQRKREV
jgi:H+/Cl- antiporter ClcA